MNITEPHKTEMTLFFNELEEQINRVNAIKTRIQALRERLCGSIPEAKQKEEPPQETEFVLGMMSESINRLDVITSIALESLDTIETII